MSRLTASRAAFDLIASFEGFRTRAALTGEDQWTLGFGHTATAREGLSVTRAEAEELLRWDLLPIEDTLRQVALMPLSQNQFDALVSFAFNIGIENFKTSDVLKYLNQGQPIAAALSMHAWRRAPVNGRVLTIDALVRRRAAESAMFLETIGARPAAPSSVIRPQIDMAAVLQPLPEVVDRVEDVSPLPANDLVLEPELGPELELSQVEPVEQAEFVEEVAAPAPAETVIEPKVVKTREPTVVTEPVLAIPKPAPVVTLAEAIPQDVLREDPIILPAMPIPPSQEPTILSEQLLGARANPTPMVPDGLSPFPGTPIYAPANGTRDNIVPPANDGLKTRLHNAPEILENPNIPAPAPILPNNVVKSDTSWLLWGLIALGAALLVFGLLSSWNSGILTVSTPRRDPSITELSALLAAASGLIIMVTSAVAALTAPKDES